MTNNLSKELKKYYCEVGKFLSCSNKEKKNIIGSIRSSVECYLSENPDSNIDDIIKKFGSAKDIADEYYNNESTEEISAKMKNSKKILLCVVSTLGIALLAYIVIIVTALLYDMRATSAYSETVIIETSQSDIIKGEQLT